VTTTQIPTASGSQGQPTGPLPPPQSDIEIAEQTWTASHTLPASEGPIGSAAQPQLSPESRQMMPQISLLLPTTLLWPARLILLPPILSFWSLIAKGEREYVDRGSFVRGF
jgi:hypothetical protein